MTQRRRDVLPRRQFVKAAVAIGGASALSACLDWTEGAPPTGVADPATLPDRQHAWNAHLATDSHGNAVAPRHHVLLLLDLASDGPPSAADREAVAGAFRSLERAYARSNEGLLFTVGYSPAYFERFDASLPESVDLPAPEPLADFEDSVPDDYDAVVHLASDRPDAVLAAEQALRGERDAANGVSMEADLGGVFAVVDRRTGFVGSGLPADNQDVAGIPDGNPVSEDSPLFMGFKSGFTENQATEDAVTIDAGPFAGGTTQHVSKLRLRLEDWYDEQDREDRVAEMFSPVHAEEGMVDGVGDNLGDDSGLTDAVIEGAEDHAYEYGRVGHTQKAAAAREDDSPRIIRRDFDSTDDDQAWLHFVAVQRGITDFVETREAMNGADLTDTPTVRERVNNGILEYMFVKRRGNYLLPPREHRALPSPQPSG